MSATTAYLLIGILIIAAVWIPLLARSPRVPVTLPLFSVLFGLGVAWLLGAKELAATYAHDARQVTLGALIVGVVGAGLRIDRPPGWRAWGSAWRLLICVMPLSILGTSLCAMWLLGFDLGHAILLGAILSPTDPVLASTVQVGPPGSGEDGEVRFALTGEAGLNDGLALPFVVLGLTLLEPHGQSISRWLYTSVVYEIGAGVAIGYAFAWLLVRGNHALPERYRLSASGEGMLVLGIGYAAYGLADIAHANGFVAVFTAAAAIRRLGENLGYFRTLSGLATQFEHLAMSLVLAVLGAAIVGGLLDAVHAIDLLFIALALLVIRPLAALVSFAWSHYVMPIRLAVGFLGVRGLASLYYASAYAAPRGDIVDVPRLWAVVGLTVLISIAVYGISSEPLMRYLDKLRARDAKQHERDEPP